MTAVRQSLSGCSKCACLYAAFVCMCLSELPQVGFLVVSTVTLLHGFNATQLKLVMYITATALLVGDGARTYIHTHTDYTIGRMQYAHVDGDRCISHADTDKATQGAEPCVCVYVCVCVCHIEYDPMPVVRMLRLYRNSRLRPEQNGTCDTHTHT